MSKAGRLCNTYKHREKVFLYILYSHIKSPIHPTLQVCMNSLHPHLVLIEVIDSMNKDVMSLNLLCRSVIQSKLQDTFI